MRIPKALRPLRHAAAGLEPNKTLYYHPVVLGSTSPPSLFGPIKPSSPSPGLHLLAHSGMQPRGLMEGALAKAKIFGNLVTGRNLGNLETNHQGNDYRGRDICVTFTGRWAFDDDAVDYVT